MATGNSTNHESMDTYEWNLAPAAQRPTLLLSKPLPPSPPATESAIAEEPELEAMEEIGSAAHITSRSNTSPQPQTDTTDSKRASYGELLPSPSISRPLLSRSYTAPGSPISPAAPVSKLASLSIQPRNRSPYSRPHLRSHSSSTSPLLQPSTRSKSLSYVETSPFIPRPSSPLARPVSPFSTNPRRSSPLRRPLEESHSFSGLDIDQTISENKELDLKPRPGLSVEVQHDYLSAPNTPGQSTTPVSPYSGGGGQFNAPSSPFSGSGSGSGGTSPFLGGGTFPRMRRRPSSPLHVSLSSPNSRLHTSSSSPALRSPASPAIDPMRFNEAFPQAMGSMTGAHSASGSIHAPPSSNSAASGSSMPSTPSSFRSRSPSMSSLETIPDSPDAEEEAIAEAESDREKDAIARLKAAVEKNEAREREGGRRGRSLGRAGDYFGGLGQDKRKRWSVCGAERRGDLEMETIWED